MLSLLIQLPPSLTKDEGLPKLERLVPHLWKKYRYAIEVRHKSWFTKEVYRLLKEEICPAWSQLDAIQTPPELTTDFFYLCFIGDRSIGEMDYGQIQKDRVKEMEKWASVVKKVKNKVSIGIASANNPYAGFGPATANAFRKMLGQPEAVWEERNNRA